MARTGRPPNPSNVRSIDGRRPGRQLPSPPPAPEGVEIPEPRWADVLPGKAQATVRKDAARFWRDAMSYLEPAGYLLPIDGWLLREVAITAARLAECERTVSRQGLVVEGEHGRVLSRYTTAANGYAARYDRACSQLGLSPVARARLGNPKAKQPGQGASRLFS